MLLPLQTVRTMCRSRGGGGGGGGAAGGSELPEKSQKLWGFLAILVWMPLKSQSYQASLNVGPSSARQQTLKVGPPLTKLSGSAHALALNFEILNITLTFANSLDPGMRTGQNVNPDLDPKLLTTLMRFS